MKKIISVLAALIGFSSNSANANAEKYELDYEHVVLLDAENLAEQGIKEAYSELSPELAKYIQKPQPVKEIFDSNAPSYKISFNNELYIIYSPEMKGGEEESWARATFYFFQIVNSQLKSSNVKFYAINSGNDLGGLFLTQEQVSRAQKSLSKKSDWPYLPSMEKPWYGLEH